MKWNKEFTEVRFSPETIKEAAVASIGTLLSGGNLLVGGAAAGAAALKPMA